MEKEVYYSDIVSKKIFNNNIYSKDLSIIVPVYNVEKYLRKCLTSLTRQNNLNYEVIIVNDGSKDNSQEIIDEFLNNYPAIFKAYLKENGGLADARNYGIARAGGYYLAFLDSDDYVDEDYYTNMYQLAKDNDADLVISDLEYVFEDDPAKDYLQSGFNSLSSSFNHDLFLSPLFSWNKLYKHALFKELNLSYPFGLWYEDIPVTLAYFAHTYNLVHYKAAGIHYLQRNSSIMGSAYSAKMNDIFDILNKIDDYFKTNNLFDIYYTEIEYLYIEHLLLYGAFRFLRTDHYKELMRKALNTVKKEFPGYLQNKYYKHLKWQYRFFIRSLNKINIDFWHFYLKKD